MSERDLPASLGDVFSTRDARAAGVGEGRLRGAQLESPLHGTRSVRAEPLADPFAERARQLRLRCRAFAAVAVGDFAFSHQTAAALLGIALPWSLGDPRSVHVAVTTGQPRRAGVVTHRVTAVERITVESLPVVAPIQAWLQLADLLTLDDLIVAGDCLVRAKRPLCSMADLHAVVAGITGVRGIRRARLALVDIRSGAASPPETSLRLVIVRAGLPEPVIGYTVHFEGYWVGTPDLAFVREKVALEYQGAGHREEAQYEEDIDRIERFREAGWTVIQVTKRQLRNPGTVVARVRAALARADARV
jgi:hypothetical protein